MFLLDFIKDNENWREILSQEPYCISIKEKDGYALFKYNQIESDMSLSIVKECRGVIIDLSDMKVVCRRFDKFFNADEPNAATLSGTVRAEEKIDGSIIGVWRDRTGVWRVSTNGMIDASDADLTLPIDNIRTYRDLFDVAWEKQVGHGFGILSLYKDYTMIFELVSPANRIVVPYKETALFFLGIRNNKTGEEISPVDDRVANLKKYFPTPRIFDIHSVEDAKTVAKTLGADQEGFVLVDEHFNRVKVKGSEYLAVHLIRNNDLSLKNFLATVLNDTQDDLLAYFPEYTRYINDVKTRLSNYIGEIEDAISSAPFNLDRKEFALAVKDTPHSAILFKLYSNRDYDWRKAEISIDNLNKLAQRLGL